VDAPTVRLKCAHGGLYSEELVVKLDDGSEERDYLQVRVYDSKQPLPIARGWIHYTPTRGIKPGTEVLFWNRLSNMKEAQIDFGDGTHEAFSEQVTHAYKTTGLFTVTASGKGPNNEPATVRLRVVVE